ncbi:MAG: tRNA (adenosine(37)-N6)-threonylcarbamoyltransferase complex ATPase subunit type 1 TsaE [Hornefia sp.]|nr:tRNA (adenosine(37)-N6)-threonylcarbamoyltransferase complex ATPase subunit type 1 TsaE [Hornefia sp.]
MREVKLRNKQEVMKFGESLAKDMYPGDVLALVGELGTGKTTLTKAIAKGLGITELITSPTFTIVKEYTSGRLPMFHFDVYRLESGAQLTAVGGEDYFHAGGVCIVEWADKVAEILPDDTKVIFLEYGKEEGERIYRCTF